MLTDDELAAASRTLAERDPVLASLQEAHGPCRLRPPRPSHFEALARAVAFQQLSGASAGAIWRRVERTLGTPTPDGVVAAGHDRLRATGLSRAKADTILRLATTITGGDLPLADVDHLDDETVIERLVDIRGIGPWTAHMFLLFQLRRPDVWPTGDYGVRKGYAMAYDCDVPAPRDLAVIGERFRPFRSVASWYLWRAADTATM